MNEFDAIFELEQLSRAAWPAAQVDDLDGWQLRFNDGVTRRANSVWPNIHRGEIPILKKITAVEQFYESKKLPAVGSYRNRTGRYRFCFNRAAT